MGEAVGSWLSREADTLEGDLNVAVLAIASVKATAKPEYNLYPPHAAA